MRERASEFIGASTGGVSLQSDWVLKAVNSFARAGRRPPRGGAVEGLVEEGAEGTERARANEFIGGLTGGVSLQSDWVLNAVNSFARACGARAAARARGGRTG